MAKTHTIHARHIICAKLKSEWEQSANANLVPLKGEFCLEINDTELAKQEPDLNEVFKLKVGDGTSKYSELPYLFTTKTEIINLITAEINKLDVAAYAQASYNSNTKQLTIYGIQENDGKIGADSTTNIVTVDLSPSAIAPIQSVVGDDTWVQVTTDSSDTTKRIISHIGPSSTNDSNKTLTASGANVTTGITVDEKGHINAKPTTKTLTEGTKIDISNNTSSITVTHKNTTRTDDAQSGNMSFGTAVVTGVTTDATGHVTSVTTKAIPTDPTDIEEHSETDTDKGVSVTVTTEDAEVSGVDVSVDISTLAQELGLSGAMHFIGVSTTAITDGGTEDPTIAGYTGTAKTPGNVVLYGGQEFVWTGTAWELLGDEGSYALKTRSISAGDELSGGGTLEADRTISHDEKLGTAKAGSYGPTQSSATTLTNGTKFKVPKYTVNKYGHITDVSEIEFTASDHTYTVNEGDLTIQGNGTTAATFNANDASDVNLNIKGSGATTVTAGTNEITISSTDQSVDSAAHHYTPSTDSSSTIDLDASGATAADNIDVVTGITVSRDSKGHVTDVTIDSGKVVSVGNGELSIEANGTEAIDFTANQSSNETLNIKGDGQGTGATGVIEVTTPSSGNISVSHKAVSHTTTQNTVATTGYDTVKETESLVVTGVTTDSYGHITDVKVESSTNLIAADIKAPVTRTDDSMWNYRETGGSISIQEDIAKIPSLKGNTMVWNQLVDASTSSVTLVSQHKYYTVVGGTKSIQAGAGSAISVTGGTDMVVDLTKMFGETIANSMTAEAFEKLFPNSYYPYCEGRLVNLGGYGVKWNQLYDTTVPTAETGHKYYLSEVVSSTKTSSISTTISYTSGSTNRMCIDLTMMFGPGSEPTLEECEQIFTQDYYEYNTGYDCNILDVANKKLGLESTGLNQYNNGQASVFKGEEYYVGGTYTSLAYSDGTAITITNNKFTADRNDVITVTGGGADTIINITCDKDGTYEPYKKDTLDLDWIRNEGVENFNIFDGIIAISGKKITAATGRLANDFVCFVTNYIKVEAEQTYYFNKIFGIGAGASGIGYYDENKNFVSGSVVSEAVVPFTRTIPSGISYMRVTGELENASLGCINLSNPALNGEYHPYGEKAKYFPQGLLSAGSVYDEVQEGKLIKRVGRQKVTGAINDTITLVGCNTSTASYVCALGNIGTLSSGVLTLTVAVTDAEVYYPLATVAEIPLDQPHIMSYIVDDHGTEQQIPINVSSVINAPFRGTFEYYSNFKEAVLDLLGIKGGRAINIDANYVVSAEIVDDVHNSTDENKLISAAQAWVELQKRNVHADIVSQVQSGVVTITPSTKSGNGAPTNITPDMIGQQYIDTTTGAKKVYVAGGLTSSDWILVGQQ